MSSDCASPWYENQNPGIGKVIAPLSVEPVNFYQKETVEHLVDQLIKLNKEQYKDLYGGYVYPEEIKATMKILNETLKYVLMPNLVLKFDK